MTLPNSYITAIGLAAAACTTLAFVPQVVRVWRLRRTEEISLATFLALSVGMLVWFAYGILIGSWPVIVANAVSSGLTLSIVALKLSLDRTSPRPVAR